MTPNLLNLVHVAVRSRFEGAKTYGHKRIYVYIRKIIRMLRSKFVCSASLVVVYLKLLGMGLRFPENRAEQADRALG